MVLKTVITEISIYALVLGSASLNYRNCYVILAVITSSDAFVLRNLGHSKETHMMLTTKSNSIVRKKCNIGVTFEKI